MHVMEYSLIGLLAAAVYAQAGGAASVVAQKSKVKGFSYSYETEGIFMNECTQGANQRVCRCVFGKIKRQYSETDYWKLENDLRRNIDHPEYISYLTESVEECDSEYAEDRSEGIGDGLAGMLGGGGGGIATKAKGSIRTPSGSVKGFSQKKFVPTSDLGYISVLFLFPFQLVLLFHLVEMLHVQVSLGTPFLRGDMP